MFLTLALFFSEMPPNQKQCYLWPWINRKGDAFYCDMVGYRSNYA